MKVIKWLSILVITLLVIAFGVIYFYLNTIVATQIEKFGSEGLNAKVTLGSANVSLYPIGLKLKNLSIEKSDKNDPLKKFIADEITVGVDHNSLRTDTLVVNYITVDKSEVTYELKALGLADMVAAPVEAPLSFLGTISDGIKSLYKDKEEMAQEKVGKGGKGQKFVIKKLLITNSKFIPANGALLLGKMREVELPDIELEYVNETSGNHILKNVVNVMQKAVVKKLMFIKKEQ
ncbi:MAG: hypothetical protein K0R98_50 [Rickettsiaceae bacterium]|jgi:hypothetical protein|nr:hypothetical protein [Rickettsiaceae bacterium]